jgi:hypothetical protein
LTVAGFDAGFEGDELVAEYNFKMPDSEIIFSVKESAEGGYEAQALGHSIFTQADTMGELKRNVREAVHCHFDEGKAPSVIRLHMVKDEVIPV